MATENEKRTKLLLVAQPERKFKVRISIFLVQTLLGVTYNTSLQEVQDSLKGVIHLIWSRTELG